MPLTNERILLIQASAVISSLLDLLIELGTCPSTVEVSISLSPGASLVMTPVEVLRQVNNAAGIVCTHIELVDTSQYYSAPPCN